MEEHRAWPELHTIFFNGVAKTGADTYGGFGFQNLPKDEYAFQWVGYLPAPTTGDYNIVLSSDDLLYFWIGTNALEGNYNFSNYHHFTSNNTQFAQHSLSLTGGLYYPVRMWFQEWSGAENAQVFFGLASSNAVAMNQYTIVNNSQTSGHNPPPPTYELNFGGGSAVDEGSAQTFYVGGTNVPGGTYYWTVETNSEDFATTSGEVTVSSGTGSTLGTFTATPTADASTEGEQTFTVALRSVSITGDILATSPTITINDTSLTKLQLTSGTALGFNGTDNRHVIVADNLSNWNLGDNWTIEWWQKIPVSASGFLSVLCQDANVPTYSGIDVFVNAGNICMFNGNLQFSEAAATRDEWNHIAIQKNSATGIISAYINGVSQSVSGSHPGTIAPSSPLNVVIGSRTADGGVNFYDQYFNGQLANIRISNTARYSTTFTPPTTVVTDAGTLLALDGSTGGGGMLVDESSRHTITNNGATVNYLAPDVSGTITVGTNTDFGTRYGYSTGFLTYGSISATPAAIPFFFTDPGLYTRVQFNGTTIGTTPTDSMMGTATGVTSLSVTVDGITQTLTTGGPSAGGYSIAGDPFGFATKNGQTLSFTINLL